MAFRHEARRIEARLESKLGIEVINPLYGLVEGQFMSEFDKQNLKLPEFRAAKFKEYGQAYFDSIVPTELDAINKADGMITLVPQLFSIGTFMETYHSKALAKKPVYTMVYPKAKDHPWLQYTSEKVIPIDFTDAENRQGTPFSILAFEEWWQTGRPKAEESK